MHPSSQWRHRPPYAHGVIEQPSCPVRLPPHLGLRYGSQGDARRGRRPGDPDRGQRGSARPNDDIPNRRPTMNRRHFLAASAAAAALASATSAPARQSGRLKVIVPPMNPAELADLKAAAPDSTWSSAGARPRRSSRPRCRRLLRLHHPGRDPRRQVAQVGPAAQRRGRGPDGDPRAGRERHHPDQHAAGLRPRDRRSGDRLPARLHAQPHSFHPGQARPGVAIAPSRAWSSTS